MEKLCSRDSCTGCGLCVVLCPKSCIAMEEGYLGHLFPVIDSARCINCGICAKRCPSRVFVFHSSPIKVYAGWAKDEEEYKSSTSGGAAAVLSKSVINGGGVVYGCSMLPNLDVKHIRVDKSEDLYQLKGSKYVQSSIVDIIPQLKHDILQGRSVLFIGTPCQVAAINGLYKEVPSNLYTCDIICHGVPSLKALKAHVNKVAPGKHYDSVLFRENTYVFKVISEGKEIYNSELFSERFKDLYINSFFDGFNFRDSCYSCSFARKERISDITIGDFWGLGNNKEIKEIPEHRHGCSAVIINTTHGQSLFNTVKSKFNHYERSFEECIRGNEQLQHPKRITTRIKLYRVINRVWYMPFVYYLVNADLILKFRRRK